jgi:hypothetical protein
MTTSDWLIFSKDSQQPIFLCNQKGDAQKFKLLAKPHESTIVANQRSSPGGKEIILST